MPESKTNPFTGHAGHQQLLQNARLKEANIVALRKEISSDITQKTEYQAWLSKAAQDKNKIENYIQSLHNGLALCEQRIQRNTQLINNEEAQIKALHYQMQTFSPQAPQRGLFASSSTSNPWDQASQWVETHVVRPLDQHVVQPLGIVAGDRRWWLDMTSSHSHAK